MVSLNTSLSAGQSAKNSASESATDRELLVRFHAGDESAFSEVVQRHSMLVIRVCQRILLQPADVEDAFQATFLVLARKAKSLEWHDSIAGWLHQTARRTALKLRAKSVRRRNVEGEAAQQRTTFAETLSESPIRQAAIRELGEILDAELAALPVRFREVILLSQVEGLTRDELAERLGVPLATVKDRLERGREQLRSRLLRRGITLTSATLAAWLIPGAAASAASLPVLATTTSQAACAFATGPLAAGTSSTSVSLAYGVLKMMGFEKLKTVAIWLLPFLMAGSIAFGMLRDEPTRFEKGIRGQVVAVKVGKPSRVTISIEEFGTLLDLDVSSQAKVWTAFEAGQLADLKEGQFVSLRLGDDHRTVNEIHVQGQVREASIKSVDASGKIVIVDGDDDENGNSQSLEVELAQDAILRIGGLPATRNDLKPGMQVPLEFGRDGKLVNAIEAEAAEYTLIEGEFLEFDTKGNNLVIGLEDNDDGQSLRQSLAITDETLVTVDGKPATLTDIQRGSSLKLRLSDDGQTIRAIKATSPEVEHEGEEETEGETEDDAPKTEAK
jgi:RNA polymerase sigma factor (sigma-70 family)